VGVVTTFRGLEENTAYPVALFLPMSQISPSAVLEPSQIVPLEISQTAGCTVVMGTSQVIYKELLRDNSVYYGLSLDLHPSDLQNLQHYVFRRQITILKAIRSMRL
ncbi:MAG: hypothetical protein QUS08_03355, partial [Methanothrix sp.]|nr:hypothetical protein [Methanothrix sp.]